MYIYLLFLGLDLYILHLFEFHVCMVDLDQHIIVTMIYPFDAAKQQKRQQKINFTNNNNDNNFSRSSN